MENLRSSIRVLAGVLVAGCLALLGFPDSAEVTTVWAQTNPFRQYASGDRWARAVHESGLRLWIEEYPTHDLAVVGIHLPWPQADEAGARRAGEILARGLAPRIHASGGWVEVHHQGPTLSVAAVVPTLEGAEAVEACLSLFQKPPAVTGMEAAVAALCSCAPSVTHPADPVLREGLEKAATSLGLPLLSTDPPEISDVSGILQRLLRPDQAVMTVVGLVQRERVVRWVAEGWRRAQEDARKGEVAGPGGGATETAASEREPAANEVSERAGEIPPAEASRDRLPGPHGLQYLQMRGDWTDPLVIVGFRVPDRRSEEGRRLESLRYLLAEGRTALLRLSRREPDNEPLFSLRSGWMTGADGNDLLWFAFRLGSRTSFESVEARIFTLLETLSVGEWPLAAVRRAQALAATDKSRILRNPFLRAQALAEAELLGQTAEVPATLQVPALRSSAELQEVFRRYLRPERSLIVEMLPVGWEERRFDAASFEDFLRTVVPATLEDEKLFLVGLGEEEVPAGDWEERPELSYHTAPLRSSSILRGPRIYLKEDHASSLAEVSLLYGYREAMPPLSAWETLLAMESRLKTLSTGSSGTALRAWEARGLRLEALAEPDYAGFRFLVPGNSLQELFLPVVLQLRNAAPPSEREVEAARLDLSWQAKPGPLERARGLAWKALVEDQAYRNWWALSSENQPDSSEICKRLEAWTADVHPVIFVVGRVVGTSFLAGLAEKLSEARFSPTRGYTGKASYREQVGRATEGEWTVELAPGPSAVDINREIGLVVEALLNGRTGRLETRLWAAGLEGVLRFEGVVLSRGGAQGFAACGTASSAGELLSLGWREVRSLNEESILPKEFRVAVVRAILRRYALRGMPEELVDEAAQRIFAGEEPEDLSATALHLKQVTVGDVEVVTTHAFPSLEKEETEQP